MILTVARVMLLTLIRDRGALAMVFVLPPAIFVVFAAIFSSTGQGDPDLRVGLTMAVPNADFQAAVAEMPATTLRMYEDEATLRLDVAEGGLDGGIVLRGALTNLTSAPILVLVDPGKAMAGAVLEGRLRGMMAGGFPGLLLERQLAGLATTLGPLTESQSAALAAASEAGAGPAGAPVTRQVRVGGDGEADPTVSYYAGAVAIMFLLFSATQTAAGLIDERHSGILDRFVAGPGGIDVIVLGKAVFLSLQGFVQAGLVFVVAAAFYKVPLLSHWAPWLAVTLLVALATTGLGLFVAAACATRTQAQTVSTFLVLVSSALGGSMVPRFMMPDWLRDIGAATPNAWTVDLYQGILVRDLPLGAMPWQVVSLAVLAVFGIVGTVILSRWRMKL